MSEKTETLGDAYPVEQARVRELLGEYKALGPVGAFGSLMIEQVLKEADAAAISGDLPRMIAAFRRLQGCQ